MNENLKGKLTELPDYREILSKYSKNWLWFVVAISTALVIAYLYIRYTNPTYQAKAKIQIINEENGSSELSTLRDMDFLSGDENIIEDEIEIISSRSNLIEVIERLGLNEKVILIGKIKTREIYNKRPININFITPDSLINNKTLNFFVRLGVSDNAFAYRTEESDSYKSLEFGKNIGTDLGELVITPNIENYNQFRGQELKIEIRPIARVAEAYQDQIRITVANKVSNILLLSLNDPVEAKAIDIIKELIDVYNENAIADRKEVADRTSTFIEERIKFIYENLSDVDATEENFRTARGLTDIQSESDINLNVGAATQQQLNNVRTELNIAQSMRDVIKNDNEYDLMPANVGLSDPSISATTSKYNQLISERNRLLKSSNDKNPIIVNLNQEINGLKQIMQSSLNSTIQNLDLQASGLSRQQSRVNSKIYSTPKNQRALRDITRQKETTESLYLYLLQKREEAQIAYASSKPKSKIIDQAYPASEFPISPKKPIVYVGLVFFAFIAVFSIIFILDILDNKVQSRFTLEKLIGDIPILGEAPKIAKVNQRIIKKDDRSALAESFRIISTNLEYILKQDALKLNNMIFITSSVPGEGKTFVASNLAMILATKESSVLLIGADIRNPQIDNFFSQEDAKKSKIRKNVLGLTDYLSNPKWKTSDIISTLEINSKEIDIIHSGKLPPNPGDLLKSPRLKKLMNSVKEKYDFIIVDTAPMMVVSDTLRLTEYADHIIYVSKAGKTEVKLLEFPINLVNEGKLKNLSFVVNNVKISNLGYYGKYGYGY